ncbi:MAG: hypothetical protein KI786_19750 [Mameliella sp.]|nr:hypothetical protein [Phaeodactylibacter sp.]NRA49082.1 hypothetical protein [Phaeodactylibacter sp.]
MDASNQTQLLLCALRHFDISVQQSKGHVIKLAGEVQITIEPDGGFLLRQKGRNIGRYSDVVRLCSALQDRSTSKGA